MSAGRGTPGPGRLPEDSGALARTVARVRRHVHWARTEGIGRLVEEDQLDPRVRLRAAVENARWLRRHGGDPGRARAAIVVGVQRSGTNMVVRGIESEPSVQVYNENHRKAFERFSLRGPDAVRDLVTRDRHRLVLFKALCDSHRTADLLDAMSGYTDARAVWIYRGVDDRVRSAVSKFGDVNRRVLEEIARGEGLQRWQAQRLSEDSLDLIRRTDPATLSAESGAALFWLVRNRLYLEQGLHERADVHLVRYEDVVASPAEVVGELAGFLGLDFVPRMVEHVDARSGGARPPLDLHPEIRAACEDLETRLREAVAAKRSLRRAG